MIRLKNTKNEEVIEITLQENNGIYKSEFYDRFIGEYLTAIRRFELDNNYKWKQDIVDFEVLENDFEKDIVNNFNLYTISDYKMLEWKVDN